jgi:O-succinylhomoserine sulfhydrylase
VLSQTGDHVVAARALFGAIRYVIETCSRGSECRARSWDGTDLDAWRNALRPNTKLLFFETPVQSYARDRRHRRRCRHRPQSRRAPGGRQCLCLACAAAAMEFGADIVIHSSTKYIDGQGRAWAGLFCVRRIS